MAARYLVFKRADIWVLLLVNLIFFQLSAQDKSTLKKIKKADSYLYEYKYTEAKEIYLEVLDQYPDNRDFNFLTGLCYFESGVDMENSIPYLKRALELSVNDTIGENLLYYAKILHFTAQFERAIKYYNLFKTFFDTENHLHESIWQINHYIEMCNNGIELMVEDISGKSQVKPIGPNINTPYPEYAPLVNREENIMIITSRRPESSGGKLYHDNLTYEDIYLSEKDDEDNWNVVKNLDEHKDVYAKKINTKKHDAAVALSSNGNVLYIYHKNDIWKSSRNDNGKWSEPVRMNKNVNLGEINPSVFVSHDEQEMYIVSVAEGGFGAKDIYVSYRLDEENWTEPQNLGLNINTEYDEDAPFLTTDGKTLFFSSKGHSSMGGYDIFRSDRDEDGEWGPPENVGFPVNSGGDDIYYLQNVDATRAYFASLRPGGMGHMDIYQAELDCRSIPNTEIFGYAMLGKQQLPAGGKLSIFDVKSGESMGTYEINPKNGTYNLVLPPQKTYRMELDLNQHQTPRKHTQVFTVPKQCEEYELFQSININSLFDSLNVVSGSEAHFRNAFFNIKDSIELNNSVVIPATTPDENENISGVFGKLFHNEFLVAEEVELCLVKENGEIVRTNHTNRRGEFAFENFEPKDAAGVIIDVDKLRQSYFGDAVENENNDVTVKGHLNMFYKNDSIVPFESVSVYVVDENKRILNTTKTNSKGYFETHAFADDAEQIKTLNEELQFVYSLYVNNPSVLYSAYIKTLDPKSQGGYYTEFIDIIDINKQIDQITSSSMEQEFADLLFDFDKYFLRDTSKMILDRLYEFMASNTSVKLALEGHADWIGTEEYNMKLSDNRAESAKKFLLDKGIDPSRLTTIAFGETKPKAANENPDGTDNPENRQLNRRVEIKVNIPDVASMTLFL